MKVIGGKKKLEKVQTNLPHDIFINYYNNNSEDDETNDEREEMMENLRLKIKANIDLPYIDVEGVAEEIEKIRIEETETKKIE